MKSPVLQAVAAPRGRHEGAFASLQSEALSPLPPPPSEGKNGNQPFSVFLFIFAISDMHFAPSMPPSAEKNK